MGGKDHWETNSEKVYCVAEVGHTTSFSFFGFTCFEKPCAEKLKSTCYVFGTGEHHVRADRDDGRRINISLGIQAHTTPYVFVLLFQLGRPQLVPMESPP